MCCPQRGRRAGEASDRASNGDVAGDVVENSAGCNGYAIAPRRNRGFAPGFERGILDSPAQWHGESKRRGILASACTSRGSVPA